ncbi:MAG: type II toxin-antitoxin system HicB family antitoxin [Defluviitaleaceae bacterium]|nr:type II toxin-antitoxin system HicB family antitoxin [Defluviitaleaceae bacterium]
MPKYVYPAIFEPNELGGICVFFPDLENVFTQGEDLPRAMEMAEDVLCLMLYNMEKNRENIPKASKMSDIKVKEENIINLVACDTQFYKNYFELLMCKNPGKNRKKAQARRNCCRMSLREQPARA